MLIGSPVHGTCVAMVGSGHAHWVKCVHLISAILSVLFFQREFLQLNIKFFSAMTMSTCIDGRTPGDQIVSHDFQTLWTLDIVISNNKHVSIKVSSFIKM